MSAHAPRPYQTAALAGIEDCFKRNKRALLVLPTGTGKTRTFTMLIEKMLGDGRLSSTRPAFVIADAEELLDQAVKAISQVDGMLRIGLERAETKAAHGCEVIVASIQTVGREGSKRLQNVQPGLIIIDEAHKSAAKSYHNLLRRFGAHEGKCNVLGCTATPKRLDKQALHGEKGSVYEEVAYNYSIREAIADGFLCTIRGYTVRTEIDLSSIATQGGDFQDAELATAVDDEERTEKVLDRWQEKGHDRPSLAFCVTVEHSKHVAAQWRNRGVEVMSVDGKMDRNYRKNVLRDYLAGNIQCMTNCQLLTTGFDYPALSCILGLRPTMSWSLFVQMLGRGTRIFPGKDDLIFIDAVDNYHAKRGGLASLPTILDLPPTLDLEGTSLEDAAKLMDEVKRKGSGPLLQSVIGDKLREPKNLRDVRSLMEQIDLLAFVEPSDEVLKASTLPWLGDPSGQLSVSLHSGARAMITPDTLGVYHFQLRTKSGVLLPPHRLSDDVVQALRECDRKLLDKFPDLGKKSTRCKWRNDPANDSQIQTLVKYHGMSHEVASKLTKGQASNAIDSARLRKQLS